MSETKLKRMSPAMQRAYDLLPLQIPAKVVGYGWVMPLGIESRTIDGLVNRGWAKKKIVGAGANRRLIVEKVNLRSTPV